MLDTKSDDPPAVTDTPMLEARGLSVVYRGSTGLWGGQTFRALDRVNLRLDHGETLGLIGESGSGKTTLGKALLGLTPIDEGEVRVDGRPLATLHRRARRDVQARFQMVFQDPYASLHPRQRISETLLEPLRIQGRLDPSAADETVERLLERVGLEPEHARRYPRDFSGGQRQRIAIARALAIKPDAVVADEPVSALDVSVQAQVLNLLRRLTREETMAMLFISHDLSVVRYVCERIAVLYLGRIVEVGKTDDVLARPQHPYTTALISAAPRIHRRTTKAGSPPAPIVLKGDVPSHASAPDGCPFHTRCWLYEKLGSPARCREERPAQPTGTSGAACFFSDRAAQPLSVS